MHERDRTPPGDERAARAEVPEADLRTLADAVPSLIAAVDGHDRCRWCNAAFARAFGHRPDDVAGRPLREVIGAGNRDALRAALGPGAAGAATELDIELPGVGRCPVAVRERPLGGRNGRLLLLEDLTERLRVDETRGRLMSIIESTDDAVLSETLDGIITSWNRGAQKLYGYTPADVIGQPVSILAPAGREEEIPAILARLRRGESIDHVETVRRRKDGTLVDVLLLVSPIRSATGDVIGASAIARDVSAWKRTERTLRTRTREQAAVARLGEIALRERDVQTVLDTAVVAIAETLEVEFAKVLELAPDRGSLHLRAGAGWRAGLVGTAEVSAGADSQAGYTLVHDAPVIVRDLADETRFSAPSLLTEHGVVSGMSCIIRGASGRPWGVLGTHSRRRVSFTQDDVTFLVAVANVLADAIERRQTEDALRESETQFHQLTDAISQLAWLARPDGHIFWFNQRWYQYTGQSPKEAEGWGWQNVHDPAVLPGVLERWRDSLRTGATFDMTFPLRGRDGVYRPFLTRVSPLRDEDGRIVRWCGTNTDVTEQLALQSELRETAAELSELNRRKDRFLATLAHELRNPLAPIRTGLALLAEEPDPLSRRRILSTMRGQVGHMVRLVDDLLDVARISRGKVTLRREILDLRKPVAAAIDATRPFIDEAGQSLRVETPAEAVPVHGDRARLTQVFSNLIHNAVKYTSRGGSIAVRMRRDDADVRVEITDDGCGLAPDDLERIFDVFVQIQGEDELGAGGLGLGLTTVRSFVSMHGGSVRAESAGVGRGSTFTVTLPATMLVPTSVEDDDLDPDGGTPTAMLDVLVVDDNAAAADLLAQAVRAMGHRVRVGYDGREAVELAGRSAPDVVLMDIGMPVMNGLEAARRIRQDARLNDTVVVALTGWGQGSDRRRAREAGFDHHLVKPVEPHDIERLLARVAGEQGRRQSPAAAAIAAVAVEEAVGAPAALDPRATPLRRVRHDIRNELGVIMLMLREFQRTDDPERLARAGAAMTDQLRALRAHFELLLEIVDSGRPLS